MLDQNLSDFIISNEAERLRLSQLVQTIQVQSILAALEIFQKVCAQRDWDFADKVADLVNAMQLSDAGLLDPLDP